MLNRFSTSSSHIIIIPSVNHIYEKFQMDYLNPTTLNAKYVQTLFMRKKNTKRLAASGSCVVCECKTNKSSLLDSPSNRAHNRTAHKHANYALSLSHLSGAHYATISPNNCIRPALHTNTAFGNRHRKNSLTQYVPPCIVEHICIFFLWWMRSFQSTKTCHSNRKTLARIYVYVHMTTIQNIRNRNVWIWTVDRQICIRIF